MNAKIWFVNEKKAVVCQFCGAEIMSSEENMAEAPPTAGLYSSSNAAENWTPDCPKNCPKSLDE